MTDLWFKVQDFASGFFLLCTRMTYGEMRMLRVTCNWFRPVRCTACLFICILGELRWFCPNDWDSESDFA